MVRIEANDPQIDRNLSTCSISCVFIHLGIPLLDLDLLRIILLIFTLEQFELSLFESRDCKLYRPIENKDPPP